MILVTYQAALGILINTICTSGFHMQLGKVHLIWQGGMKILRGVLRKFLDTRKRGSEKIVGLGGGAPKICILQNQQEGGGTPKKLNR